MNGVGILESQYINEAKKYCGDMEKLFITIVALWSVIAALGLIVFLLSGYGLSVVIIAVAVMIGYSIKRGSYINLMMTVNNDIRAERILTTRGVVSSCVPDIAYRRFSGKEASKIYAGERYIITIGDKENYRTYKNFNVKRLGHPTVEITYLERSKVVLKMETILDVELENFVDGDIKNSEVFTEDRKTLKILENKIRFPVIKVVSKDDIMNSIYINVYYEKKKNGIKELYTKDNETWYINEGNDVVKRSARSVESDLMLNVCDNIKRYASANKSEMLKNNYKLKRMVEFEVLDVYNNINIVNTKVYIERS